MALAEGLGYTAFTGSAANANASSTSLRLNVLSVDTLVRYNADWFPWEYLVPFVEGGYQYSFYDQNGSTDLSSAQGSTGQFCYGAGLRFWVNRALFNTGDFEARFKSIPVFLTLRYDHVDTNYQMVDLGSDAWLGGLEIAL